MRRPNKLNVYQVGSSAVVLHRSNAKVLTFVELCELRDFIRILTEKADQVERELGYVTHTPDITGICTVCGNECFRPNVEEGGE